MPADSYASATTMVAGSAAINVALARAQQQAYVAGLEWLGFSVRTIAPAHDLPDSCFVEDPAVMTPGKALIARSAHPVRDREADSVAEALGAGGLELTRMADGATLDGGDVLRLRDRLYVSPTARTNQAGIEALAAACPAFTVVPVALPEGILHLKCVCSRPIAGAVVVTEGTVDPAVFGDVRVCLIPNEELYAANTVGRRGRVLVAAGYPATVEALRGLGLKVRLLDVSEFRKGDGSLTCLSLREPG